MEIWSVYLTLIVWIVVPVAAVAIVAPLFKIHKLDRRKQAIIILAALVSVALSYTVGKIYSPMAFLPLLLLPLLAAKFEAKMSLPRSSGFAFAYVITTVLLQLIVLLVAEQLLYANRG